MFMKTAKALFLSLLFLVLFCSSQALAIDLYGFGSYWDQKDTDGKWGGGLGLSIPLFTEYVRLDGRAYFFENSDLGTDELKLMPFDIGLQGHFLPHGRVDPYILAGISYVYADTDIIEVESNNISGYIGVGLDVTLGHSPVKLFGEALYRGNKIETEFGEDIDVSGFTGNIGLKLHF
jgi:Outer membrane protein beta-barrel domain